MMWSAFVLRDIKSGSVNPPFFVRHKVDAFRSLVGLVQQRDSLPAQYPTDFELVEIGEFCDRSLTFQQGQAVVHGTVLQLVTELTKGSPPLPLFDDQVAAKGPAPMQSEDVA